MLLVREKPRVGPKKVSDSRPHRGAGPGRPPEPVTDKLMACLQPGDVLLVEGQTRVSVAIKYLTQSTWSH